MTEHKASRTLVKSPPELWAELSDQVSLSGHLAEPFGEIRITRLEPETAVAWEGERASGTVRIEPSGWGTRVTLTARAAEADPPKVHAKTEPPAPEPTPLPPPPEPLPPAAARPPAASGPPAVSEAQRRGLFGLLRGWRTSKSARAAPEPASPVPPPPATAAPGPTPTVAPEPAAAAEPTTAVELIPTPSIDHDAVLAAVLDRLGSAHHRPFSRA